LPHCPWRHRRLCAIPQASEADMAEPVSPRSNSETSFESLEFEVLSCERAASFSSVSAAEESFCDSEDEVIVLSAHTDDGEISVASSEGHHWFVVDQEDVSIASGVEEEQCDELGACVEKLPTQATAQLLAAAMLQFSSPLLENDQNFRGDVTNQWIEALVGFPRVNGAFCLGRVAVSLTHAERARCVPFLGAAARVAIMNTSTEPWNTGTSLRIVAGDAYGFDATHIGPVEAGCGADITLDLALPLFPTGFAGQRSAWVLADDKGDPFGPLLVLEVVWI